jgi:cell wall-associated NlpC family hydrolase
MNMKLKRALIALAAGAILTSTSACTVQSALQTIGGNCTVSGTATQLTAEQNTNAKTIVEVALGLGMGQRAAEIGVVVALTESTLNNVGFGDIQNGSMTSSRGLFQQIAAWGPETDRTNPTRAATMFFTGGQAGQKGLKDVPGWQTMTIPQAAQAVEQSEFPDGSNYAKNLATGLAVTASLIGTTGAPACGQGAAGTGAVVVNGVNVTIPSNEFVAEAVRGKVIQAPNEKVAHGLAAGFAKLGLPYVWGGSDANGGAEDNGCSRGGGALNSCGSAVGFDCSGFTAYMIVAMGFPGPGTNSAAQRGAGINVSRDNALPGDILGRPGHVAMSLGTIDGVPYIAEASDVGIPLHIGPTNSNWDVSAHRYWSGANAA